MTLKECLIKYSELQKDYIRKNKQRNIDIINKAIDMEIAKLNH